MIKDELIKAQNALIENLELQIQQRDSLIDTYKKLIKSKDKLISALQIIDRVWLAK